VEQHQTTLGADFAQAFAAKDGGRVRELVHPEIDFRALTPSRNWEQAYIEERDGKIGWMRVVCSGFRPAG
jgi:hypothetical protein